MPNAISWFEIPAADFERACNFYAAVLDRKLEEMEMQGIRMAFLTNPAEEGVSGAVCEGDGYKPSMDGALVYLNGGEDLAVPLSRVESAGGTIIMPKTQISEEHGHMAMFTDTEGNRVAFHSPK